MKIAARFSFALFVSIVMSVPSYASIPTTGKGMWIWQIWTQGTLGSMITTLQKSGVTWVAVKLGDSNSFYDGTGAPLYNWAASYGGFAAVIDSFHNNGIKLYGWQYVYGTSKWSGGGTEAGVTNEILDIPGIDGFIIDAEVEFEASGMTAVAAQYLSAVRTAHPKSFVVLTSFARVTGQPIPWTTFLSSCNANMPQAYWALRPTSVSSEFNAMRSDFESWEQTWINEGYISSIKPILPIGCENSDGETGYQMQYGDIQQFCSLSQSAGYVGVSLWRYGVMDTMNWRDYANSWGNPTPSTPEVTSASVSTGDTLQVYDSIEVSFNTAIDANSLDSSFTITPHVDGKLIMNPDFTNWIFAPDTLLAPSTNYTITINTSATSLIGTPMNTLYSVSFSTGPVDTAAPGVIAMSPGNGGTCVSKAYVEFILNEPVNLNNISSHISFVDSTGKNVTFSGDQFRVTPNNLSIIAVRATNGLTPGMRYTVTLSQGVTSYYGVPTRKPYSTTFTVSSIESGGSVIEGFESSLGTWQQPFASPLTHGIDSSASSFRIVYKPYDGFNSAALNYRFDSTSAFCAVENSQGIDISSSGSFGIWIFGDNSGNELDFIFGPTSNKVVPIDTINWYGWKFIGMWRSNTDTATALFKGLAIKRLPNSILESGMIYIDDIQVNGIVTGVGENVTDVPNSFMLDQNYPNPFNPTTIIRYQLKTAANVSLKVYDVLGRKVATLVNKREDLGNHSVTFDAGALPSGVYFYRLEAGTYTATKKMLMIK
ncbi:MAG: Ig-like domain-containing protein [Bacteroidetes bacterium]|nr:Ig-like domain-containing protein [Bacteroidota bacterium]